MDYQAPSARAAEVEDFREWITARIADGSSQATVRRDLFSLHNIDMPERTFQRKLKEWGVKHPSKRPAVKDTVMLRYRIAHAFHVLRYSDEHTSRLLEDDGFVIGPKRVKKIRKKMGLLKKVAAVDREAAEEAIRTVLREELDDGDIEGLGRRLLYEHMRNKWTIVGQKRVYDILRELNPDAVHRRTYTAKQHRGAVILPGPNYAWSMDAYCKMEYFGFQIYGCTDAFARYITWIYIGITGRTQVSVWKQYVKTADEGKVIDRGGETRCAADAHLSLRRQLHDGPEPLAFDECFRYGTSKMNQRIESWWRQQTASTARWRQFFMELHLQGLYLKKNKYDRIAMLFVYMPIIRSTVLDFVHLWNTHHIRSDKKRPWVVSGMPHSMYFNPRLFDAEQMGVYVPGELLEPMKRDLEGFALNEHLPAATMEWCEQVLQGQGFAVPVSGKATDREKFRIHPQAYMTLRSAIRELFRVHGNDALAECPKPYASEHWRPDPNNDFIYREANERVFDGPELEGYEEPTGVDTMEQGDEEEFDDDMPEQFPGPRDDGFVADSMAALNRYRQQRGEHV